MGALTQPVIRNIKQADKMRLIAPALNQAGGMTSSCRQSKKPTAPGTGYRTQPGKQVLPLKGVEDLRNNRESVRFNFMIHKQQGCIPSL